MRRAGRADRAAAIGRRRGERQAGRLQHRAHRRMRRTAQRHRRQAGGHRRRPAAHPRGAAAPWSAAPGQNCAASAPGARRRSAPAARACREIGDMDDQRIEIRPALGAVDRRDRRVAVGPRGEAIDRLGRHARPGRPRAGLRAACGDSRRVGGDGSGRDCCPPWLAAIVGVPTKPRKTAPWTSPPPTAEQVFALEVCAGIGELAAHDRFAAASPDMVEAIVEGIGAVCRRASGRRSPGSAIPRARGWRTAWCGCPRAMPRPTAPMSSRAGTRSPGPTEFGGQGLPFSLAVCVLETLGTANMALLAAADADRRRDRGASSSTAAKRRRRMYLAKLVSGEWPGTMNLTEPQAGSRRRRAAHHRHADRGRRARRQVPDQGHQDLHHLGRARTGGQHHPPGAGAHARRAGGIARDQPVRRAQASSSMPTARSARATTSRRSRLEHKLGIHASPTCVMSYGDNDACIGELVGAENEGLQMRCSR